MGRLTTISDFLVDTNGHCFICLSKASHHSQFSSDGLGLGPATSYSSAHALSRYLKMDMSKVFHERESIPSELLENVKRSKLKVPLCVQCSKWNKKISELCRQLEKIETEVTFYLELVQESMLRSSNDDDDKSDLLCKLGSNNINSNGGLLEKERIVKALRTEAMERCSDKLKADQPSVKLRNLTSNQIFSKAAKIKSKSRKTTLLGQANEGSHSESATYFTDADHINTEGSDIDRQDGFDDNGAFETMDDTLSGNEEVPNNAGVNGNDNTSIHSNQPTATAIKMERTRQRSNVTMAKVFPPTSSTSEVPKLTYEVNPETGKFKCNICSAELIQKCQLNLHYKAVHLKIKHKCTICGKEFGHLSNYKTHHRVAHVGVRFKCNLCGKCLTSKQSLIGHQQSVHFAK